MVVKPSPSVETILETRDLVCRLASARLNAAWSETAGAWDLDNPGRLPEQRKDDYLTLLQTSRAVMAALEATLFMAASGAERNGASFAEIGAAQGMSRQAARQWLNREAAQQTVSLIGGPQDGRTATRLGSESEIRFRVPDPWRDPWLEDEEPITAVYRKKYGSPTVFEFHHLEDHKGTTLAVEPDRRPRVHQIARAWELDSRTVLRHTRVIDPLVRTLSSRVDLTTVEQLREIFSIST